MLNHKPIEYPIESQLFQGHKKKTAVTATTKTTAQQPFPSAISPTLLKPSLIRQGRQLKQNC